MNFKTAIAITETILLSLTVAAPVVAQQSTANVNRLVLQKSNVAQFALLTSVNPDDQLMGVFMSQITKNPVCNGAVVLAANIDPQLIHTHEIETKNLGRGFYQHSALIYHFKDLVALVVDGISPGYQICDLDIGFTQSEIEQASEFLKQ